MLEKYFKYFIYDNHSSLQVYFLPKDTLSIEDKYKYLEILKNDLRLYLKDLEIIESCDCEVKEESHFNKDYLNAKNPTKGYEELIRTTSNFEFTENIGVRLIITVIDTNVDIEILANEIINFMEQMIITKYIEDL